MQTKRNNKPNEKILILADFSEGNWRAIQFAMKHLFQSGSEICIVQTWQKANFGFSMVRDLAPILQNIAINELEVIKTKLLKNYPLDDTQIKLYPFEGNLPSFFSSEVFQDKKWHVVMAPGENSCKLSSNPRIAEIIDGIKQPLYILTGESSNTEIDDVNVFAKTVKPSKSVLSSLAKMALNKEIEFRVYLDSSTFSVSIIEACKRMFSKVCKGSSLQFYESENADNQLGLGNLPQENGQRLIVFDENYQRKYNTKFRSYIDSWFVRSKGICVGNS